MTATNQDPDQLIEAVCTLAREAGAAIMPHYRALADGDVSEKIDGSPVTAADHAADQVILAGLRSLTPDIPIITEEEVAAGRIPALDRGRPFWLVDPLDGTKEFIKKRDEFTVNIALIQEYRPVLGVVYAPALDQLFGGYQGGSAFIEDGAAPRAPIAVRQPPEAGLTLVASRSHGKGEGESGSYAGYRIADVAARGSSLKFGLIAAGKADIYPRPGPTSEWDTAAGDAVLRAAGGHVMIMETGAPLLYGTKAPDFLNPAFIATGPFTVPPQPQQEPKPASAVSSVPRNDL